MNLACGGHSLVARWSVSVVVAERPVVRTRLACKGSALRSRLRRDRKACVTLVAALLSGRGVGGLRDFRAVRFPLGRVVVGLLPVRHAGPAVELFAQDVGVPCVSGAFVEHVDHDVEELDVGSRPPRHVAGCVDVQGADRLVGVFRNPVVERDDLFAGLGFGGPVLVLPRTFLVSSGRGVGKRSVEDLAEVPGVGISPVLDQAQEVGAGRGQRSAQVVVGEPLELPEQRLADLTQFVVQVLLREFIDHGMNLPGCRGGLSWYGVLTNRFQMGGIVRRLMVAASCGISTSSPCAEFDSVVAGDRPVQAIRSSFERLAWDRSA